MAFNYASPGAYFATAVVKNRLCVLGEIKDSICILNSYGEIVGDQWRWLLNKYPYLAVDEFVVMPNHFHGIINIDVGNGRDRSLQRQEPEDPQSKIKSVSELIGAFKTRSSKSIHDAGLESFQWQKSFYDRVIRNERELNGVREYIQTNVLRWELDIENASPLSVGNGLDRSLRERAAREYYRKIIEP